jgi:hypothetical protein
LDEVIIRELEITPLFFNDMDTNSIQEVYNKYFSSAYSVLEIFYNHFGEENVDSSIPRFEDLSTGIVNSPNFVDHLKNFYRRVDIIVKFPEVTITNEKGNSVFVKNLFAKQTLVIDYRNNAEESTCVMDNAFQLSRSHFYKSHLYADYMHSHCNGLPFIAVDSPWLNCCLGSGPIRNTISTLCTEYNLNVWQLYCFELDSYVHTESLAGGPWRRMSNITSLPFRPAPRLNNYVTVFNFPLRAEFKQMFKDFIEYFVRHTYIPFCYVNKSYMIALPYLDFAILTSNKFIEWMNLKTNSFRTEAMVDLITHEKLLNSYLIKDNKIEEPINSSRSVRDLSALDGRTSFTFKGVSVVIEVEEDASNICTTTTILKQEIIGYIATLLTKSINYYYGNKFFEASSAEIAINRKYRFL